ncbi:MAG TPA: hypothetical protein VFS39_04115 [Nitrospira sp.]|nr:hypothetical protein [Nitrospira sp.]
MKTSLQFEAILLCSIGAGEVYGERIKEEVNNWAHRRYCCWTENYAGYDSAAPPKE